MQIQPITAVHVFLGESSDHWIIKSRPQIILPHLLVILLSGIQSPVNQFTCLSSQVPQSIIGISILHLSLSSGNIHRTVLLIQMVYMISRLNIYLTGSTPIPQNIPALKASFFLRCSQQFTIIEYKPGYYFFLWWVIT